MSEPRRHIRHSPICLTEKTTPYHTVYRLKPSLNPQIPQVPTFSKMTNKGRVLGAKKDIHWSTKLKSVRLRLSPVKETISTASASPSST